MTDIETIRELASQGIIPSEIAKRVGISRQRVYQICHRHNIPFTRYDFAARGSTKPRSRIITGGVEVPLTHSVAGRIAELLVSADLMAQGWQVYQPIMFSKGHDLIAVKSERLITIEVRSAHRRLDDGQLTAPKKAGSHSMHHAYVVTGEPVFYRPPLPE